MMVLKQSDKLMRKPSGGERAWFLEEESEPRNKRIFLAGENQRADVSACLLLPDCCKNCNGFGIAFRYTSVIIDYHDLNTLTSEQVIVLSDLIDCETVRIPEGHHMNTPSVIGPLPT